MAFRPELAAWAFVAGAGIPVMVSLNAGLARALGSAPWAVVALALVGALLACALALALGDAFPARGVIAAVPPFAWAGGLLFLIYIASATFLVPRFGVGNFILFAMTAQIFVSAAIDHFGLFGVMARPVGALRAGGVLLMLAGLVIAQAAGQRR